MRLATTALRVPYRSFKLTPCRFASSSQPPPAREYKAKILKAQSATRTGSTPQEHSEHDAPDIERGIEASKRFVKTGVLDPRYKQGEKYWTRLIVALPLVIGIGWILLQRRFGNREQKNFPKVKRQHELR